MKLQRRQLLQAGTALVVHVVLPGAWAQAAKPGPAALQANAFIRIAPDGRVTLVMSKAEMGQGIHTAFAQLLAEELDVPLARVRVEHAPADERRYGDPTFEGQQMTGGSTSIRASWLVMRQAGADVRQLLRMAAAQRWKVDADTLATRDGRVLDAARGRSLGYGELVGLAATMPVPSGTPLKPASEFKLIGRPQPRLDSAAKVQGREPFGIDVRLPGMKVAAVAACPVFGGRLTGVNDTAAMRVPGVLQVVKLEDAVAVVAANTWVAMQGLAAAAPQWSPGDGGTVDSAALAAQLDRAAATPGAVATHHGAPEAALATATRRMDAVYRAPLLAHATMEPINCTVHVHGDGVTLWLGTQVPTRARDAAARAAGVSAERVTVHNHSIGGGFGRRLEVDFVEQAVRIAREVSGPVKVQWSREEDIQHDMFRPLYHDTLAAALGSDGKPLAWTHRVTASAVVARFFPTWFQGGVDPDAVDGARELPYELPALHVDFVRCEPARVPTGFWRGVGPTHNGFVVEGFIDELAHAAGQDPLAYRRALVRDARARRVLELAAERSGWGRALPAGQGRGIALLHAFGSTIAQVAEVAVADGEVRVQRVVCAIDCGLAVNPGTITAQMEGGIVFGLTAALWGEITIAEGRVLQSNFHDVRLMRINEAPRIEVHIVPSTEAPGGVGEPGTSAVIPALANAVFAATGRRIRTLPIATQLA